MGAHGAGGSFDTTGAAYDRFMGRYAVQLAPLFADFAGIGAGHRVLDVGCGPGALTSEAVRRVGAAAVLAIDPSASFVAECRRRCPGVDVQLGRAEQLPVANASLDVVAAQLVWHFVGDPDRAAAEMLRVVRPGGTVAASVWEFSRGMEMLRAYWDAALAVDHDAPDEARTLRFGRPGEIAEQLRACGAEAVEETELRVASRYDDFDELWSGLMLGVGPAGAHLVSLEPARRDAVRTRLHAACGSPTGPFTLAATAIAARGQAPD